MKRNIKLIIEYDGTGFVGWQRQANGRSVQQVLEECIEQVAQESVNLVGAGRTDSGVHAMGQVANFFTGSSFTSDDFYRALNGVLPEDVVIHSAEDVEESFSARYSARGREYRYVISRTPTAIGRKYSWRLGYDLNIDAMNSSCREIIGVHDFQSFCKSEAEVDHYRCIVAESCWKQESGKLVLSIQANRFLHGMVRALVGTMVNVGRGYTSMEEFRGILQAKDRTKAGQSAPPQGLFLERVIY